MKPPRKKPDPRSTKVMGFFLVIEILAVGFILVAKFAFHWIY